MGRRVAEASPLEALSEVQAVLDELLALADAQHTALADGDVARLEALRDRQERQAARLAWAEERRRAALPGTSLRDALADPPASDASRLAALARAIADRVAALQERHARNRAVLERAADVAGETVQLLQRLVAEHTRGYGGQPCPPVLRSLRVDSRA